MQHIWIFCWVWRCHRRRRWHHIMLLRHRQIQVFQQITRNDFGVMMRQRKCVDQYPKHGQKMIPTIQKKNQCQRMYYVLRCSDKGRGHRLLCCRLALQIAVEFIKVKASKTISGKWIRKSRLECCQHPRNSVSIGFCQTQWLKELNTVNVAHPYRSKTPKMMRTMLHKSLVPWTQRKETKKAHSHKHGMVKVDNCHNHRRKCLHPL